MRLLFTCLAVSVAVLGLFTSAVAPEEFEGKITFKITYSDLPDEIAGMESMLPKESTLYVKGSKTAMVQDGMTGNTIAVNNHESKTSFVLMDLMGAKYAVKSTPEDYEKAEQERNNQKITLHDETKEIAGFLCKKATVVSGDDPPMTVYYTEDLKVNSSFNFSNGLEGFPLSYSTQQSEMTLTLVATEVVKETVDDSRFEIPEGYTTMTPEELQKFTGR
ncbi:MAG: hypothetical protein ACFB10_15705 [Salibacteraceae bacterium]